MRRLTKNFNFLENEIFSNSQKITNAINLIENIEKLDNPEKNIHDISSALECLLDEFIVEHNIFEIYGIQQSLNDKIVKLYKTGRFDSKFLFNIMHGIKDSRNFVAHKHTDLDSKNLEITKLDVLSKLKNLFEITITLFENKKNDILLPESFDEQCYVGKYEKKDIGAISETQRQNTNKAFMNIENDLKIDNDNIKDWLSILNSVLLIPIYQRKYEWSGKNVEVLFDDILLRMKDNEEHYFGTIAQKKKINLENVKLNEIKIIDGQQRITTSLLFVCAARQLILENKWSNTASEIDWYQDIISKHKNPNKLSDYIYNPGGTATNNETFRKILDNIEGKSINDLELNFKSNYAKNYKIIYEKMKKELKELKDVSNFINTFLYRFKVASISFDYLKFSNKREMEIFESLNSKGLELSIIDLIKNHLFNYCTDWMLNNYDKDIPTYYNQIITSTQIENNLEDFYTKITEFSCGEELSSKDNKRDRFIEVRTGVDKFLNKKDFKVIDSFETYQKLMLYLKEYMYLHKEILTNEYKFIKFIECEQIIDIISDNKKRQLFIYFLFIIYDVIQNRYNNKFSFDVDSQEITLSKTEIKSIKELFLEVTKFIIRVKIISGQGDSNFKRIILKIVYKWFIFDSQTKIEDLCEDMIGEINFQKRRFYSYENFKFNLNNITKHSQVVELLVLTELTMLGALFHGGEEIKRERKSIEHILPQNTIEWEKDILDEADKEYFNKESKNFENKIGNFLILSKQKNSKGRNNLFKYKKGKIYSSLVSPLYKNEDIDIDVSNKEEWTFNDIEKRTKALINYILKNVITE